MSNSDYRDGIEDDCNGTLLEILEEIAPKIPGAVTQYIQKELVYSVREYFRLSQSWLEYLRLPALNQNMMPYNVNPVDNSNSKVYAILGLTRNGLPLHRGAVNTVTTQFGARFDGSITKNSSPRAYYCNPPTTIYFLSNIPDDVEVDNLIAQVSLVPLTTNLSNMSMPEWIIEQNREGIIATAMSRMYREINKPYTSKTDAEYYGRLSRYYIAQAKVMAQKNYGNGEHQWMFPRATR